MNLEGDRNLRKGNLYRMSYQLLHIAHREAVRSFRRDELPAAIKKSPGTHALGVSIDAYPPLDTPEYRVIGGWLQRAYTRPDVRVVGLKIGRYFSGVHIGVAPEIDNLERLMTPSWLTYPGRSEIFGTRVLLDHKRMEALIDVIDLLGRDLVYRNERGLSSARKMPIPARVIRALARLLTKEEPSRLSLVV